MSRLIWLHEDLLRLDDHPVFNAKNDKPFFVWDPEYLQKMDYGFKKLVFIYETLCEMGIDIYKGPIVQTVLEVSAEHDAFSLYTVWTPNPDLQRHMDDISKRIDLNIMRDIPFAKLEKSPDLKRFFRYWNKAKIHAFEKNGGFER